MNGIRDESHWESLMSRGRGRRSKQPAVDAVLDGATAASAAQLIGLINQVNPTGRGLASTEKTRRYRQKNRLQALLIERFADDLDVVVDPASPGVVSIRRRHFPDDACHAVVGQLDADSRSWIQRHLDMGEAPEEPFPAAFDAGERPARPTEQDDHGNALAQGRRALEEYDFDKARVLLRTALRRSRGAPEEAVALLDLLVDHLGDDPAALSVGNELSEEARRSSRVRLLLAMAAARTGDRSQARDLLRGVSGARQSVVWAALARGALQEDALSEVEECLSQVRDLDPGHGELPGLEGALVQARDRERRALVEDMDRAWKEGHHEDAGKLAKIVMGRNPGDARAAALLRQLEELHRSRGIRDLLRRADKAERAERHGQAIELWHKALRAGARSEDVHGRIQKARQVLQSKRDAGAVREVVHLLDQEELERGLIAYLALRKKLRGRVRARTDLPILGWLEEVCGSGSRRQGAEQVAAVTAFSRARALLADGRWPEVERLLRPHTAVLQEIEEAKRCLQELDRRCLDERRSRIQENLAAADKALARGFLGRARARLDKAREMGVQPELRQLFSSLEGRTREAEAHADAVREYDRLLAEGDLLEARQALYNIARKTDETERERWQEEDERLRECVHAAWHLRSGTGPLGPLDWWSVRDIGYDGTGRLLSPSGGTAVLVHTEERSLFVLELDVSSSEVRRWLSLRTPEPLTFPSASMSGDGRLVIYGEQGRLLRLAADTLEPEAWWSIRDFLPADLVVDHARFSPNTAYLWCDTRTHHGGHGFGTSRMYVVDLHKNKVCHDMGAYSWITPLIGSSGFQVADTNFEVEDITLYANGSGRGASHHADLAALPSDVVIHPDGRQVVVLCDEGSDADDGPGRLLLQIVDPDGEVTAPWFLADHDGDSPHAMATSFDEGLSFVVSGPFGGNPELAALRFEPTGPCPIWRVPVPRDTVLLQDPASRTVAVLCFTGEGIHVSRLGHQPPEVPRERARVRQPLPDLKARDGCGEPIGDVKARMLALAGRIRGLSPRDQRSWEREYVRRNSDDPAALWVLARAHRLNGVTVRAATH